MKLAKCIRYTICAGNGICCGLAAALFGWKGAALILLGELLAALYATLTYEAHEKSQAK